MTTRNRNSARELISADVACERVLVDAGAAAVADARDVTLLRVRVLARDGSPIVAGILDVAGLVSLADDAWLAPLRLRRAIAGELTELDIPVDVAALQLTASSSGYAPSGARLDDLRVIGGRRRLEGTIIEDVALTLGAEVEQPALFGAVLVDGHARAPDGLTLELNGIAGDVAEQERPLVDAANARYSIARLPAGELHVLALSDETSPAWIRVPERGAGAVRLDLELSSGIALELEVLDASTHRPASGARLSVERSIATRRSGRQQEFGGDLRVVTTDASGLATVRGIPRPGKVIIAAAAPPARTCADAREALLELDLDERTPDIVRASVTLASDEVRTAALWGFEPADERFAQPRHAGGLRVVAEVRRAAGTDRRAATLGEPGRWSLQVEAPSDVLAWVERDRRRVSRVERVELAGATTIGPLGFEPVDFAPVTLTSRGGELGNRVEVLAVHASLEERVDEFEIDAALVERTLTLSGACTLVVRSLATDGAVEQRAIELDPARRRRVDVAWDAAAEVVLRATLDGAPFGSAADVLLHRMAGDASAGDDTRALRLESGASRPVRLARGRYFFRIDGALDGALVCGIVDVAGGSAGVVRLVWSGERVQLPAHAQGIELTRCGELELAPEVPAHFRRVLLGSLDRWRGSPGPRSWRVPSGCTWSVVM